MLELRNVSFAVNGDNAEKEILKDVSFIIKDGKFTVITGPNGGGKSTLAKLIAGIEHPTGGQILFNGQDITDMSITDRSKLGISYAFQQPVRFKGLTVRDLLELSAEDTLSEDKLCAMLSTVGLCAQEYIDRNVDGSLSGGESKRIEIATVLNRKNAKLLVFDEPEAGIDLWSFSNLIKAFEDLKKQGGRTIVIISHQERIMEIADHIAVIAEGKVQTFGPGSEVLPSLLCKDKKCACPMNSIKKEGC